eukprot:TRINITY_DN7505_c0_g1_i1.p1 TRINITY_DN7505_c0_g1~~TRINITY_DN7505_c0_g1_i1.p1  ORF type:complete len:459 (+),score=136.93 TRINITY_DN7505_c0_g1_i1:52-1428(+)
MSWTHSIQLLRKSSFNGILKDFNYKNGIFRLNSINSVQNRSFYHRINAENSKKSSLTLKNRESSLHFSPFSRQFESFQLDSKWNSNNGNGTKRWSSTTGSKPVGTRQEIFDDYKQHFGVGTPFLQILEFMGMEGNLEGMEKLIETRKMNGFEFDLRSYSVLINTYGKASKFDKVQSVMNEMAAKGIKPDVVLYTNLIKLAGEHEMWDLMDSTFIHMKKRGIDPGLKAYSTMLRFLAKKKDLKAVTETMEEMKADGVKPDIFVYNTLLGVLGGFGLIDAMLNCFTKMKKDRVEPNIITFGVFANHMSRAFEWERLQDIYDEMIDRGVSPNRVISDTILRSATQTGDQKLINYWLERLEQDGLKKSFTTFMILFKFAKKDRNLDLNASLVREILTSPINLKEKEQLQDFLFFIEDPQLKLEWIRFFGLPDDYVVSKNVFYGNRAERRYGEGDDEITLEIK